MKLNRLLGAAVIFAVLAIFLLFLSFRAPGKEEEVELVVFPLNSTKQEMVEKLADQGFVRSQWVLRLALVIKQKAVEPGGYWISKTMNAWKVAEILVAGPQMKWVVVPEGLRKEEIGERLAEVFAWSEEELSDWNSTYTRMEYDYLEGVYFPDTYLIPVDEGGLEIAERMIARFNEKFAPYLSEFLKQNIKWTTGLKIASIIQREAAGEEDMTLIAGILWNRLLDGMKLEVDATVQYARGKTDKGWWAAIKPEDKLIDSPYNTYKYEGLPPHPICNPGIAAIEAVLNPEETDCLYYLHDSEGQIHCAENFEGHEANIEKYIR